MSKTPDVGLFISKDPHEFESDRWPGYFLSAVNPKPQHEVTPDPKPENRIPTPSIINPKPQTLNTKPQNLILLPSTLHHKPETLTTKS